MAADQIIPHSQHLEDLEKKTRHNASTRPLSAKPILVSRSTTSIAHQGHSGDSHGLLALKSTSSESGLNDHLKSVCLDSALLAKPGTNSYESKQCHQKQAKARPKSAKAVLCRDSSSIIRPFSAKSDPGTTANVKENVLEPCVYGFKSKQTMCGSDPELSKSPKEAIQYKLCEFLQETKTHKEEKADQRITCHR